MNETIDAPIEIREGFYAGDNTNIMPVKSNDLCSPSDCPYIAKEDEVVSICCYYLEGFIEKLLNKYYSSEIQFDEYKEEWQNGYEEFGWNFYSPDQIDCLLKDLKAYIVETDEPVRMKDFYSRFIERMEKMLQNMDGYDLILFCGP